MKRKSFYSIKYAIAAVLIFFSQPALAADEFTKVGPSKHAVSETIDRLESALKSKGINVMARIDHAAGAKKAGLDLPPTTLLIFGNPKLGTPLMQSNRMIALDLPMKALAWEDEDGKVWLSYTTPETLKARHDIGDRDKVFEKMTGALANFAKAATGD